MIFLNGGVFIVCWCDRRFVTFRFVQLIQTWTASHECITQWPVSSPMTARSSSTLTPGKCTSPVHWTETCLEVDRSGTSTCSPTTRLWAMFRGLYSRHWLVIPRWESYWGMSTTTRRSSTAVDLSAKLPNTLELVSFSVLCTTELLLQRMFTSPN